MMISTRGRYALRVLADLAEHDSGEFIPLKEVADRQRISLKYIDRIMPVLTKNGYVLAMHGKGGGYKMLKSPKDCTIGDILRLTEGSLAPVSCLMQDAAPCPLREQCRTLSMWERLDTMISGFFDGITLADLIK